MGRGEGPCSLCPGGGSKSNHSAVLLVPSLQPLLRAPASSRTQAEPDWLGHLPGPAPSAQTASSRSCLPRLKVGFGLCNIPSPDCTWELKPCADVFLTPISCGSLRGGQGGSRGLDIKAAQESSWWLSSVATLAPTPTWQPYCVHFSWEHTPLRTVVITPALCL